MNTYTRRDLINDLANRQGVTKARAQEILECTLGLISDQLGAGNGVSLRRFGAFSLRQTKPRVGRNPNNPDVPVPIPARFNVKFQPSTDLREAVSSLRPHKPKAD